MSFLIHLAERSILSDTMIRTGIRKLLDERLDELKALPHSEADWLEQMKARPLAEATEAANEQHYEIPAAYFEQVLGPHLKYSAAYWPAGTETLEAAEAAMLALTCERAGLADGQAILELGCGWGSLSLWMAARYPEASITAVSNSRSQRAFIEAQAKARGLCNLRVLTCDINTLEPEASFDRIVSVEMFEHVRNHAQLMDRIAGWLKPDGRLFVHIFAHRSHSYLFEHRSAKDWMSRHFFTGGVMPSAGLLPAAAKPRLAEEARWALNGKHYSQTLEAWLRKQDADPQAVRRIFKECYGSRTAGLWQQRWRIFYMACSELFAYNDGEEWQVMHYRFTKA